MIEVSFVGGYRIYIFYSEYILISKTKVDVKR